MRPSISPQHARWMAQWRSAAVALEQVRIVELATIDLNRIARDLEDVCRAARFRPSTTSGLVDQQREFRRVQR
jgi:hypothetical protein